MKAKEARRWTESYWDKVNLYSVVTEDYLNLEPCIKHASYSEGKSELIAGEDLLPRYMIDSIDDLTELNEDQRMINEKRRAAYLQCLEADGYQYSLDQLYKRLIIRW